MYEESTKLELVSTQDFVEMFLPDEDKGVENRISFATVHDVNTSGVSIIVDGESEPTIRRYKRINDVSKGDRVLIIANVVIGKLK